MLRDEITIFASSSMGWTWLMSSTSLDGTPAMADVVESAQALFVSTQVFWISSDLIADQNADPSLAFCRSWMLMLAVESCA